MTMFQNLARYNAWANRRLYQSCSALGDDEIRLPRPSFFGSILATLNHGLVGDMLWMERFTDGEGCGIPSLDHILHEDFTALSAARAAFDDTIIVFFDGFSGDPDAMFSYHTIAGTPASTPLGLTMMHMFNHATHHRGQVHDMLSATTAPPPPLDLIYFLRDPMNGL